MFRNLFLAGAKNLEAKKEYVNELNVFPVPDGDTGTNMTLTIMSAARELQALPGDADLKSVCKAMSSGSLRGARGNSGVILSQLFRGMCKVLKSVEGEITIEDLVLSFDKAVEEGVIYKVVTTNLVYQSPELLSRDYFISCDMSKYIALIIDTLNHDCSLSGLLEPSARINRLLEKYKAGKY